jgi:hypothetical protein
MNPKKLAEIVLRQSRISTSGADAGNVAETRMTVAQKIEEYIFRIGCSNAHALGLVLQLLTVGKVRVDFREYYERLQLVNKADVLPRNAAIPLVEGFLNSLRSENEDSEITDLTQKIIVQTPKPRIPQG